MCQTMCWVFKHWHSDDDSTSNHQPKIIVFFVFFMSFVYWLKKVCYTSAQRQECVDVDCPSFLAGWSATDMTVCQVNPNRERDLFFEFDDLFLVFVRNMLLFILAFVMLMLVIEYFEVLRNCDWNFLFSKKRVFTKSVSMYGCGCRCSRSTHQMRWCSLS